MSGKPYKKPLTGIHGNWKILKSLGRKLGDHLYYWCECQDCGLTRRVCDTTIIRKKSHNCKDRSQVTHIGAVIGNFTVERLSTEPGWHGRRRKYGCRCSLCGETSIFSTQVLWNAKAKGDTTKCVNCKDLQRQKAIDDPLVLTPEQTAIVSDRMRRAVYHTIGMSDQRPEIISQAWEALLLSPGVKQRTFDSLCAFAYGIARQLAKRTWNKSHQHFIQPLRNTDGTYEDVFDDLHVPTEQISPSLEAEAAALRVLSAADIDWLVAYAANHSRRSDEDRTRFEKLSTQVVNAFCKMD